MSSVDSLTESGFTTCSETSIEDEEDVAKSGSESSFKDLKICDQNSDEGKSVNNFVNNFHFSQLLIEYFVEDLEGKFEVVSAPSSLTTSKLSHCPSNIFASKMEGLESKSGSKVPSMNTSTTTAPEIISDRTDTSFERSSYNTKMRMLTKYLTNLNLSEQKAAAMDDSDKGWVSSDEGSGKASEEDDACSNSEWVDIVDTCEDDIRSVEDTAFINFGVLWAIIDFVFE